MTELTIHQALKQGTEAHKAGRLQEAAQLYTAILKAYPKHPYANYHMGVLAIGAGRVEKALPFFKAALESNASTAQFWISYIDSLIKMNRLVEATAVLDQARSKGAKGYSFDNLERRLIETSEKALTTGEKAAAEHKPNILDSPKLNQAIKPVKKQADSRKEAKRIHQDILMEFPKNKTDIDGLKRLSSGVDENAPKLQDAPKGELQSLRALYNEGQLTLVVAHAQVLTKQYPGAATVWNLMGAAAAQSGLLDHAVFAFQRFLAIKPKHAGGHNNLGNALKEKGNLEEAINAYKKALDIEPGFADAYYNMGISLQEQDKLGEAIGAYKKALAIEPYHSEVYNNMGNALQQQGKLEEAILAYNKALIMRPDNAQAYNNSGNALNKQGKLKEAMEAYTKALAINPDYPEAAENSQGLAVQLLPIIANYGYDFYAREAQVSVEIMSRPKFIIHNMIRAYLDNDFSKAHSYNENFKAYDQKTFSKLNPKDKVFCVAYSNFIGKLLDANWDEERASKNKVYHLGESHSLSYAHRNITIGGSRFRIAPRMTFGAKAFHFSQKRHNNFKAITKAHLVSLPESSKIFLSYGEIDCRPSEGFISAAEKLDKPLEELIDRTTEGYVKWFLDQNADHRHRLYFINVPAPTYDKKHSADLNYKVARAVALFNIALEKYSFQHGFGTIDVFRFTVGKNGFSNGIFHIDNYHLGAEALSQIQRQLACTP